MMSDKHDTMSQFSPREKQRGRGDAYFKFWPIGGALI